MVAEKNVINNFLWRFLERCGAQGVTFIVSVILARLLQPEVHGTIALITVFTTMLQVFIDSGMGNALIQKKNADEIDFSTVFYFNIAVCIILYFGMYIAAPFIANFYGKPEIVPVIRVLSLTLVVSGVKNVQQAYVSRNLLFKRFFFAALGGTLSAAVVGIWMAYRGYGVWALVVQHLVNTSVGTILLWVIVRWRPQRVFSFERLKTLYSFGWKLLVSGLLDTIYNDLRQLIIGKMYSSLDLAFYNRGKQLPQLVIKNINSSIDSVLLPTMSAEQDDKAKVRSMTRWAIQTSTYIMAPLMLGMAAIAEPLVRMLLTEKWLPCVLYLRIFCVVYVFYPIHTANLNAIKAMGRSDLFLKLEIVKKLLGVTVVLCTMWFGVEVMAYSSLVTSVMSQVINSWPNRKLLDYDYLEQLKDILPNVGMAAVMAILVYGITWLNWNDLLTMVVQIVLGAILYIFGSYSLKNETFFYVLGMLKTRKKNTPSKEMYQ